jgi:bacteriocin biosynthesis cyclodehydratase domain-containing protein
MTANPQIKPHLHAVVLPGEGVLLVQEQRIRALHGALYERLIPLLDGSRSSEELVAALAPEHTAVSVYFALLRLQTRGYLCEALNQLDSEQGAFWAELGVDPEQAHRLVSAARVAVMALGAVDPIPVIEALTKAGLNLATGAESVSLTLVVCDDYLHPELDDLNRRFQHERHPWLLLRPRGRELWMGPLYRGGEPGCHTCLARRLQRHRAVEQCAAERAGLPLGCLAPPAASSVSLRLLAELVALETGRILADASPLTPGHVLSLDCSDYKTSLHSLLIDPHCPVCGTPPNPEFKELNLEACAVGFDQDGGHRHVAPEDTLRRYERFVSPITGVVSRLLRVDSPLRHVHVYVAGRNQAQPMETLADLRRNLRSCSAGKGASDLQARTSALCESLERFSAEADGSELIERGSLNGMQQRHGDGVLHPNDVMRFSARQFDEREAWNARGSRFNRVPDPLDPDQEIDWTPLWSLSRSRRCFLPTQLLYFQSAARSPTASRIAIGCSNGNASGNTLEEAVLQGFLELVERDSTAIWWYNRLQQPALDLSTCADPWIGRLLDDYAAIGREVWMLDLTTDLGIPSVVAISRLRAANTERILLGLGCHLDPGIAVQRALAEMNQMLGIAKMDLEADAGAISDIETADWFRSATVANRPWLLPDPSQPARRVEEMPSLCRGDLLADTETCLTLIASQGLEMLVLDQTRPLVGLPAVKVVVPGLRHFWARYGEGRLYDVPVKLGWLDQPLNEEQLNPTPIFF